jgi:transposase-like protein
LRRTENRFVERSNNIFLQLVRDFDRVCPKCKSIKISNRTRKTPKYKCQDCGNEFDDPKAMIIPKTQNQINDFGKQYHNPDS